MVVEDELVVDEVEVEIMVDVDTLMVVNDVVVDVEVVVDSSLTPTLSLSIRFNSESHKDAVSPSLFHTSSSLPQNKSDGVFKPSPV